MTLTWNDLRIVRRVRPMERLPHGFAVAWWKDNEMVAIALPIGLHVIASWVRARWHRFIVWRTPSVLEQAFRDGEQHGRQNGYNAGYTAGYQTAQIEERARQLQIDAAIADIRKELEAVREREGRWKR